jgi:hypothetical protein
MTLPEKAPIRKPQRLGLYGPFAVLLVTVIAWAAAWLWIRGETFRQMDRAADAMAQDGYRIDWTGRELSGFPFRLDLDIAGARLREASGWALAAPRLKAEAFVFATDHWVVVAPDGITVTQPAGGAFQVTAKALRASLSEAAARPPRLSIEGIGLSFAPAPGARPLAFVSAAELHVHAKAGPGDQGAAYVELDRAVAGPEGLMRQIAGDAPVTLTGDVIYSHASALTGRGFATALGSWRAAGGGANIRRLSLDAGASSADARSGSLTIAADGRLAGRLEATLKGGPHLLEVIARRAGLDAEAQKAAQAVLGAHPAGGVGLQFQAGRTTLGPVAIGPAPRIY